MRFFVLDEVDGLLAQGHRPLLESFYGRLSKEINGKRLQLVVCSATLHSKEVEDLANKIMYHPTWVDLKVCAMEYAADQCTMTMPRPHLSALTYLALSHVSFFLFFVLTQYSPPPTLYLLSPLKTFHLCMHIYIHMYRDRIVSRAQCIILFAWSIH